MFDDQDDKTEEPTPRKLREAEEKGQVAQSPEFAAAIQAVASAAVISMSGPLALRSLGEGMERTFRAPFGAGIVGNPAAAAEVLQGGFTAAGKVMLPILAAMAFFAAAASLIQHPPVLALQKLAPSADKLNPLKNLQNLFSKDALMRGAVALAKLAALVGLGYWLLPELITDLRPALSGGLLSEGGRIGEKALRVLWASSIALLVLGLADAALAWRKHNQGLRMTKQEVRDEHKQEEGDPMLRARIRRVQREAASRRGMIEAVAEADVVVVNPIHFAVALRYDRASMAAPAVVAKGANLLAERIKDEARERQVPIVTNVPLARALYKQCPVDHPVPVDLYQAVAEVLAVVFRARQARGGRR